MSDLVSFVMREPICYVDGSELRKLRQAKEDSLRGLAKRLKRSPTYISRIENASKPQRVSTTLAVMILTYQKGALK